MANSSSVLRDVARQHSLHRDVVAASAALLIVALATMVVPSVAEAASTINVTTTADLSATGPGCSLRDAISSANTGSNVGGCTGATGGGPYAITVPVGTYLLTLGQLPTGTASGKSISIAGAGSSGTVIHQTTTARVFELDPSQAGDVAISLSGVSITGGEAQSFGGGAILGGGTGDSLTLTNVVIASNGCTGTNSGAGLSWSPAGNVTITGSTFANNTCAQAGGAIVYNAAGGALNISGSTFTGNSSGAGGSAGGALFLGQIGTTPTTFTVHNSTFTQNQATSAAGIGGAIYVGSGSLVAGFDRIVGNTAGFGGGIGVRGGTTLATDDWWGCNGGPGAPGCDTVNKTTGTITVSPWITLTDTPNPTTISPGASSTLTASVLRDSSNAVLTGPDVSALVGVPVVWGAALHGSLSQQHTTIGAGGTATAALTPDGSCDNASAAAAVDNASASATVDVLCPDLIAVKTDSLGGSAVTGQPWTWTITATNEGGGSANFAPGAAVVLDNLPSGPAYSAPTSSDAGVDCSITGNDLSCSANGAYSLAAGGSFTVEVTASSAPVGTYANPRTGGTCAVDPNDDVVGSNGTSNDCADTVTVAAANTLTTITSTIPDPSVVGQSVAVTYDTIPIAPGEGTPTGTVTVSDGVDSCSASVAAGQCTLTFSSIGAKSVTATYGGDANFNASTSSPATSESVGQASTNTSITLESPDPSVVGQSVGISFSVAAQPPGSGTPTGSVTVSDGTDSCTASVSVGQCSIDFTTTGTKDLTATYAWRLELRRLVVVALNVALRRPREHHDADRHGRTRALGGRAERRDRLRGRGQRPRGRHPDRHRDRQRRERQLHGNGDGRHLLDHVRRGG